MTGTGDAEMQRDWVAWHSPYERPDSHLSQRLRVVQGLLTEALDSLPAGPVRLLSMCAGQGRDVLGVLPDHRRREDVTALLVEADETNAEAARTAASEAGLSGVEVLTGDAGVAASYAAIVPAHVLVVCGVFGNIPDAHIARTVLELRSLAAPDARVIWTRGRSPGDDLTPSIRRWFRAAGFLETAWVAPPLAEYEGSGRYGAFSVGANRLVGDPVEFDPGAELFVFE